MEPLAGNTCHLLRPLLSSLPVYAQAHPPQAPESEAGQPRPRALDTGEAHFHVPRRVALSRLFSGGLHGALPPPPGPASSGLPLLIKPRGVSCSRGQGRLGACLPHPCLGPLGPTVTRQALGRKELRRDSAQPAKGGFNKRQDHERDASGWMDETEGAPEPEICRGGRSAGRSPPAQQSAQGPSVHGHTQALPDTPAATSPPGNKTLPRGEVPPQK